MLAVSQPQIASSLAERLGSPDGPNSLGVAGVAVKPSDPRSDVEEHVLGR